MIFNNIAKNCLFAALFSPLAVWGLDMHVRLAPALSQNLGITVGKLSPANEIPLLSAPAKVVVPSAQEYIVSAPQAGLVSRLFVGAGDAVRQGQTIAELNSADLLSLQRLYLKAVSDLNLATLARERDQKLFTDGVVPERRWQETHSVYLAAASEASERRQLLEIAGMSSADIERLKTTRQLSGVLPIHAPITGVVLDKMAVAGARVDSLTPLYRIANLAELWLEINIPQERITQVRLGDQIRVETSVGNRSTADSAAPILAHITLLGQAVNPENQTVLARALIKGAQNRVRPGQRVNIQLVQPHPKSAYAVPNSALAQHEGKTYVFVQTADGFDLCPVTVIGKEERGSVISGPLTGTETIAIQGAVALKANWLGLGSGE